MSLNKDKVFCAVDLGSSKVTVAIGQIIDENYSIKILGVSQKNSKGIRHGAVINIDMAIDTIKKAIDEAKNIADVEVSEITLGIASSTLKGFNSYGLAAVENSEISLDDLAVAIRTAKAVPMSTDSEMVHVLQRDFVVDGENGVLEPVGMFAVRLESNVHIISLSSRVLQNIKKCISNCGLEITNIVVEQLASSNAILSQNEKDMGVCLVDIGSDTTSVAVFINGAVCHSFTLPLGGSHITSDLSKVFRLPLESAESLKLQYAYAYSKYLKNPDDKIDIPNVLGNAKKRVSIQDLSEVVEARIEEMLENIYNNLQSSNLLDLISSGFVFTGGGSRLKSLSKIVEDLFKLPVRIGGPSDVSGANEVVHNPAYATVIGLLKFSANHNSSESVDTDDIEELQIDTKKGIGNSFKKWISSNF